MVRQLYIVTDLGPGDGGKGGVVHFLAHRFHPSIIIKEGGAQGSHGVSTVSGEKFNFSQWGCGTLNGVPTYLSERFIISPIGLLNEAAALQCHQIAHPFALLSVHPGCLVATPYHQVWSQIDELLRRDHPRGTVGTGVGKAYRAALTHPDLAIYARELADTSQASIREKLSQQRAQVRQIFDGISVVDILAMDRDIFEQNYALLVDDSDAILDDIADKFHQVGQLIQLADLDSRLSQADGLAVVERSHGILTDAECGFKPHVSAIRTLPQFSERMYRDAGFVGAIHHLGVHRAYEIRHGAGPLPSHDPAMTSFLPGSHKDTNRFQGAVRIGPFDTVLLNYALHCARDINFDCLCLTWFDQILISGTWSFCTGYRIGNQNLRDHHDLAQSIFQVTSYHRYDLPVDCEKLQDRSYLMDFASEIMQQYVSLPLRLVSYGATEADKIIK